MCYVHGLKTYDIPAYTLLRHLFLKGCQRLYIKTQEATVCDWVINKCLCNVSHIVTTTETNTTR